MAHIVFHQGLFTEEADQPLKTQLAELLNRPDANRKMVAVANAVLEGKRVRESIHSAIKPLYLYAFVENDSKEVDGDAHNLCATILYMSHFLREEKGHGVPAEVLKGLDEVAAEVRQAVESSADSELKKTILASSPKMLDAVLTEFFGKPEVKAKITTVGNALAQENGFEEGPHILRALQIGDSTMQAKALVNIASHAGALHLQRSASIALTDLQRGMFECVMRADGEPSALGDYIFTGTATAHKSALGQGS